MSPSEAFRAIKDTEPFHKFMWHFHQLFPGSTFTYRVSSRIWVEESTPLPFTLQSPLSVVSEPGSYVDKATDLTKILTFRSQEVEKFSLTMTTSDGHEITTYREARDIIKNCSRRFVASLQESWFEHCSEDEAYAVMTSLFKEIWKWTPLCY